jgi:Ankyrin repeat
MARLDLLSKGGWLAALTAITLALTVFLLRTGPQRRASATVRAGPPRTKTLDLRTTRSLQVSLLSLLLMMAAIMPLGTAAAPTGEGACEYAARMANRGKLEEAVLKGRPSSDASLPPQPESTLGGVTFRDRIDINGDGRPEYVYVTSEGTAHYEGLSVYDSDMKPVRVGTSPDDDWQSDNLRWAADLRVMRFGGSYYVIGKTDDNLNYLARIGPDNVERVVCEFAQRSKPAERVIESKDDALCDATLRGMLDYVPFDRLHAVTVTDLRRAGMYETSPSEKAAELDIDNDGHPDYVIVTQYASGAGRGCDSYGLALLDETRARLAASPLATLLRQAGGGCGGARLLPFRFRGKSYLEHKYAQGHPADIHEVYELTNGRREMVCMLQARVVNYVLGEYEALVGAAGAAYKNPWEYAFEQKDLKDVEILIRGGRDLNEKISVIPLLNWAVWRHRDDLLELLLRSGADPNHANNYPSPLQDAISQGTDRSLSILLRYGARPNAGNPDPIAEVIYVGSESKLRILLGSGLRPEQKHLDLARQIPRPDPEVIRMLEHAIEGASPRRGGP